MYKIIGGDGRVYGPVSAETIREWIASRRATGNTQVQPEGSTEWTKLGELADFKDALPNAPAAEAPPQIPGFDGTRPSAPVHTAPTSALAITSLVLGIVGFFCLGIPSLVGLVLGIIALIKINKSEGRLAGRGLAIAGICVSALISMMIVAALPALVKAKQRAQAINCKGNLQQLGVAARTYAQSSGGRLPDAMNWCDLLQPHVQRQNTFHCPAEKSQLCGYGYNAALSGRLLNEVNPSTVMFFEIPGGWNVSGGPEQMLQERRHGTLFNVVFADGSAQQMDVSALQNLRWEP